MPDLPGSVESPTEGAGKVSYPSPSAASTKSEDDGIFSNRMPYTVVTRCYFNFSTWMHWWKFEEFGVWNFSLEFQVKHFTLAS